MGETFIKENNEYHVIFQKSFIDLSSVNIFYIFLENQGK
jgi:hypothetical protein